MKETANKKGSNQIFKSQLIDVLCFHFECGSQFLFGGNKMGKRKIIKYFMERSYLSKNIMKDFLKMNYIGAGGKWNTHILKVNFNSDQESGNQKGSCR